MPNHIPRDAAPHASDIARIHISETTRAFIDTHAGEDSHDLALHAKRGEPGLDLPFALDQIAGRRIARTKLPAWAACRPAMSSQANRALVRAVNCDEHCSIGTCAG